MISLGTPATAYATRRAIGFWPAAAATSAAASTMKAAPSLIPDALPAVTVPSLMKAGFILASVSIVVARLDVLVGIEDDIALAGFHYDRHDLRLEATLGDGRGGTALRLDGQRVLLFAADVPLLGEILGSDTHVTDTEGVVERRHHHVDRLGIAHTRARSASPSACRRRATSPRHRRRHRNRSRRARCSARCSRCPANPRRTGG
jgi:hypothetical protein